MTPEGPAAGTDAADRDVAAIERAMVAITRARARRALARLSRRRSAPPGRTPALPDAVFELLDAVAAANGRGEQPTVGELAPTLGVDQPRASRLVGQAVEARLLRRGTDRRDARRAPVVLTAEGRRTLDAVSAFRRRVLGEALAAWPAADRAALARLLPRLVRDLAAVTEGSLPGPPPAG
ncbi:MarR family winged helix-turn-helix transcriptional regulator [Streptomyces sp. DSM 44915]|uniref:MarR family winged helix-turn-helix transcriptional regulator n=1 Tax=Streptomyces chisholmiae TaxID=3075540 RepID=A0ABU2JU74_9ACTN|nr:MarR family winged helix-turn-helix transcriptional regulator [Streptomyces sp. DSM 44915]MDT0268462.1 MarR family winged helix-turn-helix transcriptional regulator [Streptomyces sp. DSM 44915]